MIYYQNETKQNMFNSYNNMTPVERSIADFFLSNTEKMDFSSKNISKRLYVSEAALSRFSKKCGYKGYRELIFSYEKDLLPAQRTTEPVCKDAHNAQTIHLFLQSQPFFRDT